MKHRLAVVTSHVIQYQDPLFKRLARDPDLDVTVYFCSPEGVESYLDRGMGVQVQWDLDLLSGYKHHFIHNLASGGRRESFAGLINPGLVSALRGGQYDAVLVILGWGSVSAWIAYAACLAFDIPFLIYGDSSFVPKRAGVRSRIRERVLRSLFKRAAGFMVVGAFNADYYRHYGADPAHFFFMPWAIDNHRFERGSALTAEERDRLRAEHGIGPEEVALLVSGKLIERKNPVHVLQALDHMRHRERAVVLYLGDGEQREMLHEYARAKGFDNVRFLGFVNQSILPRMYAMSDVFVFPSSFDPRGTVTNEAMACGLPVVVSDMVGVYGPGDIVREGENGYVYPAGDIATLANRLDALIEDRGLRARMGRRSRELIAHWSFDKDVEGVVMALRHIRAARLNRASRHSAAKQGNLGAS